MGLGKAHYRRAAQTLFYSDEFVIMDRGDPSKKVTFDTKSLNTGETISVFPSEINKGPLDEPIKPDSK